MSNPQDKLKELKPTKGFFVGIDSDGCVFDTMEIKHKECFCPAFINHFGLQAAAKFAREAWEFVNLYSKTRGCNRFPAVTNTLDLLAGHKKVIARGVNVPKMHGLRDWIKRESKLGNPALEEEIKKTNDVDLKIVLEWSKDVNAAVKKIVRDVPPFPFVRESLEKITRQADVIVVSQTPTEALEREWQEHKIEKYARIIAGQELGSKTEHLALAAGGKYDLNKILMIGDAPGDMKAAKANKVLFYPVNPSTEDASWQRFYEEAFDKFLNGTYAGVYEQQLIAEFEKYLPEKPTWRF